MSFAVLAFAVTRFRKRMLAMDQIRETGEVRRNGSHRPARLYRVTNPNEVQIIK